MHNAIRLRKMLWIGLCLLGGVGGLAHATDPVEELDLKAAYIFNFIQFIEWPDSDMAAGNELSICVSPFSPLKRPLTALEGKPTAKGRTVRIKLLELAGIRHCRMLILQNADVEQALRMLRTLPPSHGVLTIADELTFVNPEIVIALAQQEGRIVFGISPDAAAKAGLTISSRLLRLAKVNR
ncbi:YfiR family protein [Acidovorax sp. ACV01]|uniref:YfiR family protein n=1 Tax=Acidovorax sp. ACV01 TaxID=2769311 RepID=UPI001782C569|nr:YfiR family protein [Acidovorax sp. ACV01]MBD9392760.1 YfiR family protein [Acidovorax sp. ACV01]